MGAQGVFQGPAAPRDPVVKRPGFFVCMDKEIFASPQPDGRGIQHIYEDDGRLISAARLTGSITDEGMLELLKTTEGFRKLVHSIGVSVAEKSGTESVRFVLQMYGREDKYATGTNLVLELPADGTEHTIVLSEQEWRELDKEPGQIRFEFERSGITAVANVIFYLNDGFTAPEISPDTAVEFDSQGYREMIARSIALSEHSDFADLGRVLQKARDGKEVTLAFIGGSITQGAGATPIHEKCYARQLADAFRERFSPKGDVRLIKAGVGGTPSELGMIRFERDVLRDGAVEPDVVVIEFAVNDSGDETQGVCFESLVRKALALPYHPAVVLLFAVFADDGNLQERLIPIGEHYRLPMVSVKDAVSPQFPLTKAEGRVLSKNQYFYDMFHPSNLGHRVMSDCLMAAFERAEEQRTEAERGAEESALLREAYEDAMDPALAAGKAARLLAQPPALGADFEKVLLLDRKEFKTRRDLFGDVEISVGAFTGSDADLQRVEMDCEVEPVPEFPHNWYSDGSVSDPEPFRMKLICRGLVIINKDSASPEVGTASAYVDGKKVREIDPHRNGWTHCNPLILIRETEAGEHDVEIRMNPGEEQKKFTILGFGVVK